MGIGSEVYQSVLNGRRGLGIELKESYYKCAVQNLQAAELQYSEKDFRMTPERKEEIRHLLFNEKLLPEFEHVVRVNREDGVKTYFEDGSWVICRFSGTEPLLRMAAEADDGAQAVAYIEAWRSLLQL